MRTRRLLLLFFLVLTGCGKPQPQMLQLDGKTMGTRWSVQLVLPPGVAQPKGLAADLRAELEQVNAQMSTYRRDSVLSRFNANPSTDWQPMPPALVTVLKEALRTSRLSGGAFDVTVGPLVNLWGFGPDGPRDHPPADAELQAARQRVGYQKLELREQPPAWRKLPPDLYVDLSAIAKGYAVDRLAGLVESAGFTDYLVEIGGELRAAGHNASGRAWRIAIERPDDAGRQVQQVAPLNKAAMASSGDYRNFFLDGGRRYSHTLDPRTGRPVQHTLAAVTVVASSCMRADALATALLALGPENGFELARREGVAALFIERTDQGFSTRATEQFHRHPGVE